MAVAEGKTPDPVALGPAEDAPDRPFTAVALVDRDASILKQMLGDLIGVLDEVDASTRELTPFQRLAWRVDDRIHRLLVCDEERLRSHLKLCVVGFFGERRGELGIKPLEEANSAILGEFARYPGILSYSSMEVPGGQWANLVLHDDPDDRERWRESKLHAKAVELLSPVHYWNVRIHNGCLTASLSEDPEILVERTKYWDFSGDAEWRAIRTLVETP